MYEADKVRNMITEMSVKLGSTIDNSVKELTYNEMVNLAVVGILDQIYLKNWVKADILRKIAEKYE